MCEVSSMNISIAAKSTALQSLVSAALSNPGDLTKHLEALVGLQLLTESTDEAEIERGAKYVHAVESVFSTAFRIADRPQVRHVGGMKGLSVGPQITHPWFCVSAARQGLSVPSRVYEASRCDAMEH